MSASKKSQFWNPWHGCTKCSAGCQNCYMYFLDEARGVLKPSNECHRTGNFKLPLQKERATGQYKIKPGERIRVNMTSDTFLEDADEWRDEMWSIIKQRSDVIFWLLTKRPERFEGHMPLDWGDGYPNVMLNITCENQEMFDKRIGYLLNIPAKHKGLCLAPLLTDIDISIGLQSGQIEEVSVGGENYNNPRPCRYEWVKHIADTCAKYRVNFNWYETGTKLLIGDKYYYMSDKQVQSTQAWFAGLNQKYYDVKYDLRYSDGTPVCESERYVKQYNLNRCLFCSNQDVCNGCVQCGACQNVQIVTKEELERLQSQYIKDGTAVRYGVMG